MYLFKSFLSQVFSFFAINFFRTEWARVTTLFRSDDLEDLKQAVAIFCCWRARLLFISFSSKFTDNFFICFFFYCWAQLAWIRISSPNWIKSVTEVYIYIYNFLRQNIYWKTLYCSYIKVVFKVICPRLEIARFWKQ